MNKSAKILKIKFKDSFKSWFEKTYSDHFERLLRYAYSIVKQKDFAEDIVSEVFLNIWKNRVDYSSIEDISSYLFISVKHMIIQKARKNSDKLSYITNDNSLQITDAIDPLKLLLNQELNEIINEVLNKLSPQSKIIYDLVKKQGYSHKEIAKELQLSDKTIRNQMNLILNKIRSELGHYYRDSELEYSYQMKII